MDAWPDHVQAVVRISRDIMRCRQWLGCAQNYTRGAAKNHVAVDAAFSPAHEKHVYVQFRRHILTPPAPKINVKIVPYAETGALVACWSAY